MKFHTILFDLDGTLLNTLEDLTDSTNYAMEQMGYPRHTLEEVRSFVNNGARKLILGACPPGTPEEEIDRCLGIFQAHYKTHLEVKTKPYPGILELLEQLSLIHIFTRYLDKKSLTALLTELFVPNEVTLRQSVGRMLRPEEDRHEEE